MEDDSQQPQAKRAKTSHEDETKNDMVLWLLTEQRAEIKAVKAELLKYQLQPYVLYSTCGR